MMSVNRSDFHSQIHAQEPPRQWTNITVQKSKSEKTLSATYRSGNLHLLVVFHDGQHLCSLQGITANKGSFLKNL